MSILFNTGKICIVAGMLCGVVQANAQDNIELGRFFTDPKTRMELNMARDRFDFNPAVDAAPEQSVEQLFLPEVSLNGLIIRGDGSTEVWVNDVGSVRNQSISQELKLNTRHLHGSTVRVSLPGGETIQLKPGQVYSLETAKVREAYESLPDELPEPAPIEEETPETVEAEVVEEFDESVLAEDQDSKIRLLEERIQKLEQTQSSN